MRFQKIYRTGQIVNAELYTRLRVLDAEVFFECGNEFKENRDWWVLVHKNKIIAYCGCLYSTDNVCIFVRAWVHKPYRGKGLQKRMIDLRLRAAKKNGCSAAITYTLTNNYPSANSLIKYGFKLYEPSYKWAGKDVLYFKKMLS